MNNDARGKGDPLLVSPRTLPCDPTLASIHPSPTLPLLSINRRTLLSGKKFFFFFSITSRERIYLLAFTLPFFYTIIRRANSLREKRQQTTFFLLSSSFIGDNIFPSPLSRVVSRFRNHKLTEDKVAILSKLYTGCNFLIDRDIRQSGGTTANEMRIVNQLGG